MKAEGESCHPPPRYPAALSLPGLSPGRSHNPNLPLPTDFEPWMLLDFGICWGIGRWMCGGRERTELTVLGLNKMELLYICTAGKLVCRPLNLGFVIRPL